MLDFSVLQVIWWVLIIVLLSGFVIFDGFDLGVLALNPFISKTDTERRVLINTMAPHWDGNQVWLLLGGGAIFAALPEVYGTAFSGFFLAMILILASLYFRPVGLEYRAKFEKECHRRMVDWSLFLTGVIPATVIGVALGNVLEGVPFWYDYLGRSFYGTYDDFFLLNLLRLLNPFALLTGVISLLVFTLQGAGWILLRTERNTAVYARTKTTAIILSLLLLVLFIVAGVWLSFIPGYTLVNSNEILHTKLGDVVQGASWYSNYLAHPVLFVIPLVAFLSYVYAHRSYKLDHNAKAFISSSVGVLTSFTTFAITLFPFVLPSSKQPWQSLTIWNASSSQLTLQVMFICAIIFVPLILAYTAWCYYKMWTRLSPEKVEANDHSLY